MICHRRERLDKRRNEQLRVFFGKQAFRHPHSVRIYCRHYMVQPLPLLDRQLLPALVMHPQHQWSVIWVGPFCFPPAEPLIDSTTGLGIASLQLHTLVLVVAALVMNVSPGRMCGIAVPS
jgi:hypothetical protein